MEKNEILKMFGKNLSAERNSAGYSKDKLAEKMGICAGNIYRARRNKSFADNNSCCFASIEY